MKNKKIIILMALAMSALFMFTACTTAAVPAALPDVENGGGSPAGTQEPEASSFTGDAYNFTLMDTDGNTHSLEDYLGKKVYLKFWATWCPSCLTGLAELDMLPALAQENDIVVLTIVAPGYSGEKSSEKFVEWFNGRGHGFTVLLDEGGNSFYEYGIRAVPSSYFIDTKGNLAESKLGHVSNEQIIEIFNGIR
ncbi:MAG: TlpA family protein disulfide reductase [Clostridia bacterium]|nr:TlpA family protein disulfide reductase [Clostridia bacterium]